ncbi:hypothetical protein NPIL_19831 [Nephila pilipes]|uniref:C2H2-type domain-containing protein n=1 Tax=Nephila pilipes TaxID=299642 RepID=A0A8X6PPB7_NEPPI|nr:hypothetical protein NPIL_19831 [Nephila pilipes]
MSVSASLVNDCKAGFELWYKKSLLDELTGLGSWAFVIVENIKFDIEVNAPAYRTDNQKLKYCTFCKYSTRLTCFSFTQPVEENLLISHTAKKLDPQYYYCSQCTFYSQDEAEVLNHSCQKNVVKKSFFCAMCEKSFSQKHHLDYHMKVHTGDQPYACEDPKRKFIPVNIVTILRFKIFVMDYVFKESWKNFKIHFCDYCDYASVQKSALKRHALRHTGEKPYECKLCHKSFARKDTLQKHMLTHCDDMSP